MPGPSNPKKPRSKGKGKGKPKSQATPIPSAPPVLPVGPSAPSGSLLPHQTRSMTADHPLRTLEAFSALESQVRSLRPYLDPAAQVPPEASLFGRLLTIIQRAAPSIVSLYLPP